MKKQFLFLLLCISMSIFSQNIINEKLIPFHDKLGKWGYFDADSDKIVIAAKYDFANLFENGVGLVGFKNTNSKTREDHNLSGYIRENGEEVLPINFTDRNDVKNIKGATILGLEEIYFENEISGILKLPEGIWLIEPRKHQEIKFYSRESYFVNDQYFYNDSKMYSAPKGCKIKYIDFKNHLFKINKGEKIQGTGFCTWEGKIIIKPKYLDVKYAPKTKTFVASKAFGLITSYTLGLTFLKSYLFDDNGTQLAQFDSKYFPFFKETDSIGTFEKGNGEMFYFELKTGNQVAKSYTEPIAKSYTEPIVRETVFQVFQDVNTKLFGSRDLTGKLIVDFKYKYSFYLDHGFAKVVLDSGEGVIDKNGDVIIPAVYKSISKQEVEEEFSKADLNFDYQKNTYFTAKKDEKYGLFDTKGKLIIPFEYGSISKVSSDKDFLKGWIQTSDLQRDKNGLINVYTNVIIPPIYSGFKIYDNFLIANKRVGSNYTYQLLGLDGKPISDIIYDEIKLNYDYFIVSKNKQEGIMNQKGEIIVPIKFNYIGAKSSNLILVKDNDMYYYINVKTGKEYKIKD